MKKEPRTSAFSRRARMRGTASTGPKRPCERATGSLTPRAIHSVSASTSKVKAHAARASPGQRGMGAELAMAPESSAETTREPAMVLSMDMSRPAVPLRAVTTLFLERQHLARPRAARITPRRLGRFVEDVGGIQLDSINVLDRAHYLTL